MAEASPTGAAPASAARRDLSIWGGFMWGYADVGADIYVALGLVLVAAQGAAPLAFALAGLVYVLIGLGYTELCSAYPVAGGGQYFALRGLGDFWGFVAGAALLLDYTVDIALFSVASIGYLHFFTPLLFGHPHVPHPLALGPFTLRDPVLAAEAIGLIALIAWLNVRGVKASSLFGELVGAVDIAVEGLVIVLGFLFAWRPQLLVAQWHATLQHFSLHDFAYGSSLAIISFVGLESISQAAQETRRPATIIPRTSITLIFTVFLFALAFSTLGLGMLPWQAFSARLYDPVALLASHLPIVGAIAGPMVAGLGVATLAISASSGILSTSRLTFSMSRRQLLTPWFERLHPRHRTPARAIWFFSTLGALAVVLAAFTPSLLGTLANLYAFGASLGYLLVFLSLVRLRFADPYTPRPYRMPLNVTLTREDGLRVHLPLLALLGAVGIGLIFLEVLLTHEVGRIAGPAWIALCLAYYLGYRGTRGLPLFRSLERDWESEQKSVLKAADELELLEQYKLALAARDKHEAP